MSAAATTLWARAFADELARCGVREVVVAPGSRSTPFVLALARHGGFRLRVHLDERSAAYFALGCGRASGLPAAVVTTSGTAAANLLPAAVEASQAEVPLVLLTADRPSRLRGADANQAIDQVHLYGAYARAFFETAHPELSGPAMRHLRAVACRAVGAALGPPAGPVHVNLPFDKPLEPVDDDPGIGRFAAEEPLAARGRSDGRPFVEIDRGRRAPDAGALDRLEERVRRSRRGLVVAGPSAEPGRTGPAAVALARATDFPLLADPLSGARFAPGAAEAAVPAYDLFVAGERVSAALAPDLIVRVGASPTSASLQRYLFHHAGVEHVVVDGGGRWKDHGAVATRYLAADGTDTLRAIAERIAPEAAFPPGGAAASTARGAARSPASAAAEAARPSRGGSCLPDPAWSAAWAEAGRAAAEALGAADAGEPHEGTVLAGLARALPDPSRLFVSSSMPVRDLDAFALPSDRRVEVLGNRGASGIDGVVSSAFGAAGGGGLPTACVLGDLAFFHDQNGLLFARERDRPVVFVLIDNDGGGIFHTLPVAGHEPHFTPLFATPHGLDLRHAAALHGLPFDEVEPREAGPATASALAAGATRVIRVRTDRTRAHARRRAVAEAVARSVDAALG